MKKKLIAAWAMMLYLAGGCQTGEQGSGKGGENAKTEFATAGEALQDVMTSLPQILNTQQKEFYGLKGEGDFTKLEADPGHRYYSISFDQLLRSGDSTLQGLKSEAETGMLYGLSLDQEIRLCVYIIKKNGRWAAGAAGMKKFANALNQIHGAGSIVDFPGLEISFIEMQDSSRTFYAATENYPDAGITMKERLEEARLVALLRSYAESLKAKYGDALMNGQLDR